jgi:hypothetical protein
MRAVFTGDNVLVVEIGDDSWVTGSNSWVDDDHLEIWLGEAFEEYGDCIADLPSPVQYGIGLDGTLYPGFGDPQGGITAQTVETDVDGRHVVRFKIVFSTPPARITLVYSDSEDGLSQERLLATSRLEYGELVTMGKLAGIPTSMASCEISGDSLEFVDRQNGG